MLKRHIFIGSISHSGSTLLGLVLGSLDGAANIGESQKLIPGWARPGINSADWSAYSEMHQCRLCGSACEVWTKRFRRALERNPDGWYPKLAARLGAGILVSSEKSPATIWRLDPKLANTTIVLYRHPAQAWPSFVRREYKVTTLPTFLKRWQRVYGHYLDRDRYNPAGGVVYVSFDDFQLAPQEVLKQLLERLEIEEDLGALQYWKKAHHYISGSFNVYDKLRTDGEEALQIRPPKPISLPDEEALAIQRHSAYEIFRQLRSKSIVAGIA